MPNNNGISRMTYGNGAYIDYVYNSDGLVIEEKRGGVTAVNYAYDNLGRLVKVYDRLSGEITEYTYDFLDQNTRKRFSFFCFVDKSEKIMV